MHISSDYNSWVWRKIFPKRSPILTVAMKGSAFCSQLLAKDHLHLLLHSQLSLFFKVSSYFLVTIHDKSFALFCFHFGNILLKCFWGALINLRVNFLSTQPWCLYLRADFPWLMCAHVRYGIMQAYCGILNCGKLIVKSFYLPFQIRTTNTLLAC